MATTAELREQYRTRRRRRGHGRKLALSAIFVCAASVVALWVAVNRVTWLGPYVADGLRSVVGTDAVAGLEDFAYHVQDRVNRVWRKGEKPRAYWSVSAHPKIAKAAPSAPSPAESAKLEDDPVPPFQPRDVGPAFKEWSAPGDGQWVPMIDRDRPNDEVSMMKTLLHPDKARSWAEVFVVALDLRRVRLHLVPGSKEPVATEDAAANLVRPGVIPEDARARVLAAFNGGFKTEHGHYGMFTDGTLLVKPKKGACAVAAYADGTMRIATWNKLADTAQKMVFWRETPVCMYEDDVLHWRLADAKLALKWGATLDGETVIRRSAIGIDAGGQILFVAISNNTTARVIADGMHHAGAVTVAQLDVNYSYPKFVTFENKGHLAEGEANKRVAIPLADGFEFSEDEYIREKNHRDFFYVMPKDADSRTALELKRAR